MTNIKVGTMVTYNDRIGAYKITGVISEIMGNIATVEVETKNGRNVFANEFPFGCSCPISKLEVM